VDAIRLHSSLECSHYSLEWPYVSRHAYHVSGARASGPVTRRYLMPVNDDLAAWASIH